MPTTTAAADPQQQSIPPTSTQVFSAQAPPIPCTPDVKMPVSVLVELAMKMGLNTEFETVSETGLAHDKTFVLKCSVGDVSERGTGCSKKKAKHEAAKAALDKLKESKLYQDFLHVSCGTNTESLANTKCILSSFKVHLHYYRNCLARLG